MIPTGVTYWHEINCITFWAGEPQGCILLLFQCSSKEGEGVAHTYGVSGTAQLQLCYRSCGYALSHSLGLSLTDSAPHSLGRSLTHSLSSSSTWSLAHSLTHSLTHLLAHPLIGHLGQERIIIIIRLASIILNFDSDINIHIKTIIIIKIYDDLLCLS